MVMMLWFSAKKMKKSIVSAVIAATIVPLLSASVQSEAATNVPNITKAQYVANRQKLAHELFLVRAREEALLTKRMGHPANLPTGKCLVGLSLSGAGALQGMHFFRCAPGMEGPVMKAAHLAQPYEVSGPIKIKLGVMAPNPTPRLPVH